uniref:Uncharacterized protein n=1 Tax=Cacopsylla melanoneura TaxID=428564 RepID=A0A8D8T3N9_9HEMI
MLNNISRNTIYMIIYCVTLLWSFHFLNKITIARQYALMYFTTQPWCPIRQLMEKSTVTNLYRVFHNCTTKLKPQYPEAKWRKKCPINIGLQMLPFRDTGPVRKMYSSVFAYLLLANG